MEWFDPPEPDPPPEGSTSTKRRLNLEAEPPAKKTITSPELAAASIETVYTDPSMVIGGLCYTALDKGPYVVYVSRIEEDPAAGLVLRPIRFGQFLKSHKIENICSDGVKKVGRNKISVEFSSADDANKFVSLPILSSSKYSATIPTFNVTRMGIIRQVPTDISMSEFVESLELPIGCGKVMKARRLSRKNIDDDKISWIPTQSVVVTFQGQMLPTRVFSYYTSLPVELYQYPTIQCHSCCKFGHAKAQCRSKPRCFRCGKNHVGASCDVSEINASCLHCSGHHFATDKSCPELERQKSIKSMMSLNSISYEEASAQVPRVTRSYAEVSKESASHLPSSSQSFVRAKSSRSETSQSYVKTVYSSPRPKPPQGKSYDKTAHNEIVSVPKSVLANGCALGINQSLNVSPQQDNSMLETLITLIINIILMNPNPLPSNVADKLTQLVSLSQYGSSRNTSVEHTELASQEA